MPQYVYGLNEGGDVEKFDPTGSSVWATFVQSGTGTGVVGDADGNVWVAIDNDVTKLDPDGSSGGATVSPGDVTAIAVDADGNLIVGVDAGDVYKYSSSGNEQWSATPDFNFDPITGLATGPDGNIYATSEAAGETYKMDPNGGDEWTADVGGFGVAFGDGGVYVAAEGGDLVKLDPSSGSEEWAEGVSGTPAGVAFGDGHAYIGHEEETVEKFDSSGGSVWSYDGEFSPIRDVAASGDGAYVAYNDSYQGMHAVDSGGSESWTAEPDNGTPRAVGVKLPSSNTAPTADFTYTKDGLSVDFTDQSSDPDGPIQSWSWDFGDGNTSTTQSPSHTYGSAGTYTVQLTVTGDAGLTDSVSYNVSVSAPISGTAAVTDKTQTLSGAGGPIAGGSLGLTDSKSFILGLDKRPSGTDSFYSWDQYEDRVYKRDAGNGGLLWEYQVNVPGDQTDIMDVAAGENGNVYLTLQDFIEDGLDTVYDQSRIVLLDIDGNKLGEVVESKRLEQVQPLPETDSVIVGAYGPDTSNNAGYLYRYDEQTGQTPVLNKSQSVTLSERLPNWDGTVPNYWIAIDIDEDGTVFASTEDATYSFNLSLNLDWKNTNVYDGEIGSQNVASISNKVYVIGREQSDGDQRLTRLDKSSGSIDWSNVQDLHHKALDALREDTEIVAARKEGPIAQGGDWYYGRYSDDGTGLSPIWEKKWDYTDGDGDGQKVEEVLIDNRRDVYATGADGSDVSRVVQVSSGGNQNYSQPLDENTNTTPGTLQGLALRPVSPPIAGSVAFSSSEETLTGTLSAVVGVSGSIVSKAETITGEGILIFSGGLSLTDGKESYDSAGTVLTAGTLAHTDGGLISDIQGGVTASGGGAFTNIQEVLALVGGPVAGGQGSLTGKGELLALTGGALASAAGGVTDQPQSIALLGGPVVGGSAALTDGVQAFTAAGAILLSGTATLTSNGELIAITSEALSGGSGTLAVTDKKTLLTAEGGPIAGGDSAIADTLQSLSAEGVILIGGRSELEDQGQSVGSAGEVLASGDAHHTGAGEEVLGRGDILTTGQLSIEDGQPTLTITTFVGRKPDSISIGLGSILSIDTDVQSSL